MGIHIGHAALPIFRKPKEEYFSHIKKCSLKFRIYLTSRISSLEMH
jgi:hypothetical protein